MNSDKKAIVILVISIVIFLILVLGSIIGLQITRNGINKYIDKSGNLNNKELNYIVYEDGKKENISDEVINAEFEIDGLKFSHFVIETIDGISTVKLNVQNTTDALIEEKTIRISFLNKYGVNEIEDKVATTNGEIESNDNRIIIIPVNEDISNISKIDLVVLNEEGNDNIDSGDIVSNDSGDNV